MSKKVLERYVEKYIISQSAMSQLHFHDYTAIKWFFTFEEKGSVVELGSTWISETHCTNSKLVNSLAKDCCSVETTAIADEAGLISAQEIINLDLVKKTL